MGLFRRISILGRSGKCVPTRVLQKIQCKTKNKLTNKLLFLFFLQELGFHAVVTFWHPSDCTQTMGIFNQATWAEKAFNGVQQNQHSLRLALDNAQRMKNNGNFLNILNFWILKMSFTSYTRIMTEYLVQPIILISNA